MSIDPIALGYLLEATGPITSSDGLTVSSDNASDLLLSGVYSIFEDPKAQDSFFADVTGRVFEAITFGSANPVALVRALTESVDENRIHLWSARAEDQGLIKETPLVGAVPISSDAATAFGVYFNDATGAKMDYYLTSSIAIASAVCRNDLRPNFEVRVQLGSNAPVDAGTTLPRYVTGAGVYGVAPGNVRTNIFVYAPSGSVPYSVTIDGQEYAFVSADHGGHSVAGVSVELQPQQTAVVAMKFVGEASAAEAVSVQHTPMATNVATSLDNYLDCADIAPSTDTNEQSGALAPFELGSALAIG
jgi:hypothetical protein